MPRSIRLSRLKPLPPLEADRDDHVSLQVFVCLAIHACLHVRACNAPCQVSLFVHQLTPAHTPSVRARMAILVLMCMNVATVHVRVMISHPCDGVCNCVCSFSVGACACAHAYLCVLFVCIQMCISNNFVIIGTRQYWKSHHWAESIR